MYPQFTFKSVFAVQTATEKDNTGTSLFPAMGTPAQSSITVQSRCISQIQERARNLLFSLVNLDHKIKKVIYVTMTSHLDKIHQRIVAVFQKPQAKILKEQPVIKISKIATFISSKCFILPITALPHETKLLWKQMTAHTLCSKLIASLLPFLWQATAFFFSWGLSYCDQRTYFLPLSKQKQ